VAIVWPARSGRRGTEIALTSTVADPGTADTHTYAWEIFKDGELYHSGEGDALNFTPDDEGSYEVRLTVTDDDGGATTATAPWRSPTPTRWPIIAGLPEAAVEGAAIALTGSATDPGCKRHSDLAWSVTKTARPMPAAEGAGLLLHARRQWHIRGDAGGHRQRRRRRPADGEIVVANANPVLGDVAMPEINGVDGLTSVSGTIADPGTADTFTLLANGATARLRASSMPPGRPRSTSRTSMPTAACTRSI
jgi:hypothetical protein